MKAQDLPIFKASYTLLQICIFRAGHFPKHLKTSLGDVMIRTAIELLAQIEKANREIHKSVYIATVTDKINLLQLLCRTANDAQAIPITTYTELASLTDSIQRQAENWRRSISGAPNR